MRNRSKKGPRRRKSAESEIPADETAAEALDGEDADAGEAPEAAEAGASAPPESADGLAEARRRASAEPSNIAARLELARLYRVRGSLDLAIEQLEAARAEDPDDPSVLQDLGSALLAAGRPAEAEKELRRAQRFQPQRPELHGLLGVALFKRGLYREAEAELGRAIALDDRNGEGTSTGAKP